MELLGVHQAGADDLGGIVDRGAQKYPRRDRLLREQIVR